MGQKPYVDLSATTDYSYDHVRAIVRSEMAKARTAELEAIRRELWADLEEVKRALEAALFPRRLPDGLKLPAGLGVIPPKKDDVMSLVKIVHEQALLMGVHAPKQTSVTHKIEENPLADQFANDLNEWMDLADKIARSGYGLGREELSHEEAENVLDADGEPTKPALLRAYAAGELESVPAPRPQRSVRRVRVGARRNLDDDDDDD
jgi:hypothetical protein